MMQKRFFKSEWNPTHGGSMLLQLAATGYLCILIFDNPLVSYKLKGSKNVRKSLMLSCWVSFNYLSLVYDSVARSYQDAGWFECHQQQEDFCHIPSVIIINQLTNHIKIMGWKKTAKLHHTLLFVNWNLLKEKESLSNKHSVIKQKSPVNVIVFSRSLLIAVFILL